jgi:hypothetical protein
VGHDTQIQHPFFAPTACSYCAEDRTLEEAKEQIMAHDDPTVSPLDGIAGRLQGA